LFTGPAAREKRPGVLDRIILFYPIKGELTSAFCCGTAEFDVARLPGM